MMIASMWEERSLTLLFLEVWFRQCTRRARTVPNETGAEVASRPAHIQRAKQRERQGCAEMAGGDVSE